MSPCSSALIARLAAVVAIALAAVSFTGTTPATEHATLASAFPIAEAQFAR